MAKLYNLARMSTATTGTGTITLGSAVSGFLSFAGAGIANGDVVTYGIVDGANSEIGRGTYTSSGTTLTRSVLKSTNSNSAISLSGGAQVFITAAAEDIWPARAYGEYTGRTTNFSDLVPVDDTIPQVTEGTQLVSISLTIGVGSRVGLRAHINGATNAAGNTVIVASIYADGAANAIATEAISNPQNSWGAFDLNCEHAPSSGSHTYTLRVGISAGSWCPNGLNATGYFGGARRCTLIAEEIL